MGEGGGVKEQEEWVHTGVVISKVGEHFLFVASLPVCVCVCVCVKYMCVSIHV